MRFQLAKYLVVLLGLLSFQSTTAQVLINEVSSSNDAVIIDEFGESSDWIELYNAGDEIVNLQNYYLSDDSDDVQKWTFPSVNIAPNDFLLIFASDQDTYDEFPHTNFKLAADGETLYFSDSNGNLLEELAIPPLNSDQSYGRQTDGSTVWQFFETPTPAATNDNSTGFSYAETPIFSINESFQNESFSLTISCLEANCQIYYTLDGREASADAILYTEPILITESTVVKAIAVAENFLPSPPIRRTYFVDEQHDLPVVALSTDADWLFDEETGIFEFGPDADTEWPYFGANFWKDIELPIYFEFYENEQLVFAQDVGTKIHGGRSARTVPIKPLRLLAKNDYGKSEMNYPFFPNRERDIYKRLVLRNGSGDYQSTYFRDAFLADYFIEKETKVDALAARPVIVYLNGQYWGLMNLREKSDEYYIANNFDIDKDELDLLEEDTLVGVGNFDVFDADYDFIINNDMSIEANFEEAKRRFDVENIAEIFILQTYICNSDWVHNNLKYWREQKADARWRYIMFDLDIALGGRGWTAYTEDLLELKLEQYQDTNRHVNILKALFANEDYKHYFINRYADLMNSDLRYDVFWAAWQEFIESVEPEMQRHFGAWQGQNYTAWQDIALPHIKNFIYARPGFARKYVLLYFDLMKTVDLTLNTFPKEAGRIQVNTIMTDELPWRGVYFDNVPVTLTIVPNAGYTFSHWESLNNTFIGENRNLSIEYIYGNDDAITAVFETDIEGLNLWTQSPVSSRDLVLNFTLTEQDVLSYEVVDISGKLLTFRKDIRLNIGSHNLSFRHLNLANGIYFIQLETSQDSQTIKVLIQN